MKKNKLPYHSALNSENEIHLEADRFEFNGNAVLFHDINSGKLPIEFDKCDILYSEIAWKHGIDIFNKRAEIQSKFETYLSSVSLIITSTDKPAVIISGALSTPYLPKPDKIFDSKLNGAFCKVFVYRTIIYEQSNTELLIEQIANRFNCVGDFCCGYGRTGKKFFQYGKKFVMSDYNKKCVGFIKNYYENIQQ